MDDNFSVKHEQSQPHFHPSQAGFEENKVRAGLFVLDLSSPPLGLAKQSGGAFAKTNMEGGMGGAGLVALFSPFRLPVASLFGPTDEAEEGAQEAMGWRTPIHFDRLHRTYTPDDDTYTPDDDNNNNNNNYNNNCDQEEQRYTYMGWPAHQPQVDPSSHYFAQIELIFAHDIHQQILTSVCVPCRTLCTPITFLACRGTTPYGCP